MTHLSAADFSDAEHLAFSLAPLFAGAEPGQRARLLMIAKQGMQAAAAAGREDENLAERLFHYIERATPQQTKRLLQIVRKVSDLQRLPFTEKMEILKHLPFKDVETLIASKAIDPFFLFEAEKDRLRKIFGKAFVLALIRREMTPEECHYLSSLSYFKGTVQEYRAQYPAGTPMEEQPQMVILTEGFQAPAGTTFKKSCIHSNMRIGVKEGRDLRLVNAYLGIFEREDGTLVSPDVRDMPTQPQDVNIERFQGLPRASDQERLDVALDTFLGRIEELRWLTY